MGRIHDALRRAEQERARVLGLPPEPERRPAREPKQVGLAPPSDELDAKARVVQLSKHLDRLPSLAEYEPLCSRVEQLRRQRMLRSLVIAGGAEHDGRSSTALQLARAMSADSGLEIVLVDLDLGGSGSTRWLAKPPPRGIEDVLAGRVDLDDALVRVANHEFSVLGSLPERRPGEGSGAPEWQGIDLVAVARLADALHRRFDLALVDAPALLAPGPAPDVVRQFDGWLLVIRAGVTTTDQIDEMLARLDGERLLGTVLSRSVL